MHHIHHDLIVAWAKGAKIQWKIRNDQHGWEDTNTPGWHVFHNYRIKPEPKPDVKIYGCIHESDDGPTHRLAAACRVWDKSDNIMLIFDGETGKLKDAQVLVNSGLPV
jgi:hypothetical protein